MAQSGSGRLMIDENFLGIDDPIALTAVDGTRKIGDLRVVGQGMAEVDSGAVKGVGPSGFIRLTTTNDDAHSLGLESNVVFAVALMAPLVMEVRVQAVNFTTKSFFAGFTDIEIAAFVPDIEIDLITAASATVATLVASDLIGFYGYDAEITASATEWHGVHNGGTTTGATTWSNINLGTPISVAGEYQILRLEIDPDGTARWYVDNRLAQTVAGAVSLTTNLKLYVSVGAKAGTIATADVEYIKVWANRDWTI